MPPAKKAAPARTPAKKAAARPAAKKAPAKKAAATEPVAAAAAAPAPEPAPAKAQSSQEPGSRNLGQGSIGGDVAFVQGYVAGALEDDLAPDGEYGPKTEKAVKRWQKSRGRQPNGEVRKADWRDILAPAEDA